VVGTLEGPSGPVSFAGRLAAFGSRVAVVDHGVEVTYVELADRVATVARDYGPGRRLVLLVGGNQLDCLVAYLAALAAGHVVLLVPGEDDRHVDSWIGSYDPDVVVRPRGGSWALSQRRAGTAHELHPDLALLLSTSGATGSPKLVRLSHDNLEANARAIAQYLDLGEQDRAATTLPMAYCYGLSVLHSHLLSGASLVLTELSVVDPCFWALCREQRVTSFAGVPYTFQLLDRVGFLAMDLPDLRYLTQAGGRMAAEQVRRYSAAGQRRGWQLFVMYGQTEATARMAYLPPALAVDRPEAIGVAVAGGALRLEPVPECSGPDRGEIVFTGPNVMLGYAGGPADLRRGRTVKELRTGDLARRGDDGLFEILGRRTRFAKLFGLRVDLEAVERELACCGVTAWCTGVGDSLVVLVEGPAEDPERPRVSRAAATASGLPLRATRLVPVDRLPRLSNGKVDGPAAATLASAGAIALTPKVTSRAKAPRAVTVHSLFAEVLMRDDVADDSTFAGLGGDSLSYVELSVRLEDELGGLPADWHVTPIGRLAALATSRPAAAGRRGAGLDTTVLLRAVGIALVVGSHAHLFQVPGGAHALLAVAGYNFARFQLTPAPRLERIRGIARAVRRVALPSVVCIALATAVTAELGLVQVALVNDLLGPDVLGPPWRYWFVEDLVRITVVVGALLGLPAADRAERVHPLLFPGVLLGLGLLPRLGVVPLPAGPDQTQSGAAVFWLFALGWCAARTTGTVQRVAMTLAALTTVPGFFGDLSREGVVLATVLLLIWTDRVPVPRPLRPAIGIVASSSLYVYLTHWQVLPVAAGHPALAAAGSLAVGALVWRLARLAPGASRRLQDLALVRLRAGATRSRAPRRPAMAPVPLATAGCRGTPAAHRGAPADAARRRR